jgi:PEP-CTERM motif-containing protein
MRPLRLLAAAALAATSLTATSAFADITAQKTSFDQGILVHGDGGAADVGTTVIGNLGGGPTAPHIVYFDGSTTATASTTDSNDVRLQQGAGQAELTGAVISGQTFQSLQSGDIFLSSDGGVTKDGMTWIELAFTGVTGDTIDFTLSLLGEPDFTWTGTVDHSPTGENKFGFFAANSEEILNLHYVIDGGTADSIRQVRIIPFGSSIPEPSTWALMLLGFGAAGVAMRRSRKKVLVSQLA